MVNIIWMSNTESKSVNMIIYTLTKTTNYTYMINHAKQIQWANMIGNVNKHTGVNNATIDQYFIITSKIKLGFHFVYKS